MQEEHDFTGAQRGKFYIGDAVLAPPPVYLATDVLSFLATQAEARGATISVVVNDLLRDDIARIKAAE